MTQQQVELIENSRPVSPHNRLGLDYRKVPARKVHVAGGIIDAHNHVRDPEMTRPMIEAAAAYGVTEFWTMTALEHVRPLMEAFPGKIRFIAVPAWQRLMKSGATADAEFFADWRERVEEFAKLGSRLIKFHAAPGTCRKWGISLDDPRIKDLAQFAYERGYHFMTHVGDPKAWFYGKGVYSDGTYGTHAGQFAMLERMLERYPDRIHLGAHMGGSLEDLEGLARRLEKYPHYVVDTSATKWIVRAVAEQSAQAVRDFFVAFQDRIIFGSDLVVGDKYDWDHYASRYWAHQMMWETDYDGPSPIDDPDGGKGFDPETGRFEPGRIKGGSIGEGPGAGGTGGDGGVPWLQGVDLPAAVLEKIYRRNAERWLPRG